MSALRQLVKRRRELPKRALYCGNCGNTMDIDDEMVCDRCFGNAKEEAMEERDCDELLGAEAQRELARVYLDLRHGRYGDARDRLERVLDAEAPSWRELA